MARSHLLKALRPARVTGRHGRSGHGHSGSKSRSHSNSHSHTRTHSHG
jgi:hypothetical protein